MIVSSGSQTTMSASAPGASTPLRPAMPCTRRLVGGEHGDEAVLRDAPLAHAVRPQHRRALLGAGRAVRDQREVAGAELLLRREVERAVVRAEDVQVRGLQPVPQRGPVARVAQRRREHVLRPLEALAGEVRVAEHEVLRAGLRVHGLAARVGELDRLERRRRSETCTTSSGAPAISARRIARFVASASHASGRVSAWKRGAVSPRASACCLELGDHVAVLGVDEHEHARLARDLERLEQVLVRA